MKRETMHMSQALSAMRILVKEAKHAYIDGEHERASEIQRDLMEAARMIVNGAGPDWFDDAELEFILTILLPTGEDYNEVH